MSRSRAAAPVTGAAFVFLVLLLSLPAGLAWPAGAPPLSRDTRGALASAAAGRTPPAWQRHAPRSLAGRSAAPAKPARATGVDGQWVQQPPPMLEEGAGVYVPGRESMLYFGGRVPSSDGFSNEVWELKFASAPQGALRAAAGEPQWSLVVTQGTPPAPRSGHVLIYDSLRDRLLLFGGADSLTRNDCWALDLTTDPPTWEEGLPTGTLPARRAYAMAVYDALNDQAYLFGGADSMVQNSGPEGMLADTWVLPLGVEPLAWTELTPTGTPPSARAGAAVVYDEPRQRMVLFGGYDGGLLDDCFALSLDGNPDWAELGVSGGPPAQRAIPGVVYDSNSEQMVIFSGFGPWPLADVWALDLDLEEWNELVPAGGPPSPRQGAAAVYDAPRDRMVIFGGSTEESGQVSDPLWSLSFSPALEWTDLGGRHPDQRGEAATAVDPARRVLWVHGGQGYGMLGPEVRADLWSLDLGSPSGWSEPATTGTPPGRRYGHSAVYDALRDRLVFFGGNDSLSMLNEVWELTLSGTPAWTQLSPSGTPPAGRIYHSAVYDAANDRMVVFGGYAGSSTLNDVWGLSFAGTPTWTEIFPLGAPPPPLFGQSGALDQDANRLVVFGGASGSASNSIYMLPLSGSPMWSEVIPAGTPPGERFFASMVSIGTRMLVTGGNAIGGGYLPLDDAWLLSLYPTPQWRPLDVGPTLPPARLAHAAGFDYPTFTLTIFGGQGMTSGADTWKLQLDQVVPALVSLVSANAQPGRVELSWEVSSELTSATVQRSAGGGEWTALGQVTRDGNGRLAYVDLDVLAGTRYGYRLGLPGGGHSAEAWVEVPAAARFALRGLTPNPSPAGAGLLAFTLPDASPARLEVMDVTGRLVSGREVGSLGAGQHLVRLGGERSLAPGLYLVRLTRAGQSLTAKAVTMR